MEWCLSGCLSSVDRALLPLFLCLCQQEPGKQTNVESRSPLSYLTSRKAKKKENASLVFGSREIDTHSKFKFEAIYFYITRSGDAHEQQKNSLKKEGSEAGIAQGFDASPASDNLAQLHSLCRGSTFFFKDPRRFDTAYRLEKEINGSDISPFALTLPLIFHCSIAKYPLQ